MTHFGEADDVAAQLEQLSERLDRWAALGRDSDQEQFMAAVRAEIAAAATDETAAAFEQAAPADQLYAGIARYWQKRELS